MGAKTIQDIADIVGCSSGTVSRAINNRPGINAETRRRILQVMDEVGYRPNAVAQSLASSQTHAIALIIPDITENLLSSIALAAEGKFAEKKYNIILYNTRWDYKTELEKLRFATEKRVDGIVIKPVSDDISAIQALNIPTVLISHTSRENISCIDIENDTAAYIATKYLLTHGCRRVAFISGPKNTMLANKRKMGYENALIECGMPENSSYLIYNKDFSQAAGYASMEKLMSLADPPDGVFCSSDSIALGVSEKAIELGIKVPEDFSIIGCNNDDVCSLPQIQMTTIEQSTEEMGKAAAELLINEIEGTNKMGTRKIILYPKLIVRKTTK